MFETSTTTIYTTDAVKELIKQLEDFLCIGSDENIMYRNSAGRLVMSKEQEAYFNNLLQQIKGEDSSTQIVSLAEKVEKLEKKVEELEEYSHTHKDQ